MSGALKTRRAAPGRTVLLQILVQDPAVLTGRLGLAPVHPVVVKSRSGFWEGPVCDRVAMVDVDARTGALRPPATFDPRPTPYQGVTSYRVSIPSRKGIGGMPWAGHREARVPVAGLLDPAYDDPFLKVSVFGTVIRTIAFVEHPLVLGRSAAWAFRGRQLLVVPRAGDLDNAFYHRDSRSLQLFSFPSRSRPERIVHAALSQEIVTHETGHALIDGLAPDLYSATDPETLAIHEAVADLTAVMMAVRTRELRRGFRPTVEELTTELARSSRYSRLAEEFGRGRGARDALRDALNFRTLDPASVGRGRRVDWASPHSLSQVLTGAFYRVFVDAIINRPEAKRGDLPGRLGRPDPGQVRPAIIAAMHRVGGMLYRGLDWLPPGEPSMAAFVEAVLAADRFHQPNRPAARARLAEECLARGLRITDAPPVSPAVQWSKVATTATPTLVDARRFVKANRDALGLPAGEPLKVSLTTTTRVDQRLALVGDEGEVVDLDRTYPTPKEPARAHLLKVSWWAPVPMDLGERFGQAAEVRQGLTLAFDDQSRVLALIRGEGDGRSAARRTEFLRRQVTTGALTTPGESLGPDGRARVGIGTEATPRGFRVRSSFAALHLAG